MASNSIPPLSSFSTALVLLPPPHIQSRINSLRSANDKSFPRWTAHITLVFPFVEPPQLPTASYLIRDALSNAKLSPFDFQLDEVGKFKQREYNTVFLGSSNAADVRRVWSVVSSAFGYMGRPFVPHLTLGQAFHRENSLAFLQEKGKRLLDLVIHWELGSVVILRKSESDGGIMKVFDEIPLSSEAPAPSEATIAGLHPDTYRFLSDTWAPLVPTTPLQSNKALILATYNVLFDSYHPTVARLPRLLSALLSMQPMPDLICLQEVTDDFLQSLLSDSLVRTRWPWCTHAPTSVLPSERNIVVLAREPLGFTWHYVHLRGKRKPAVLLQVPHSPEGTSKPGEALVIVGVHLTAGLSPSDLRKKFEELDALLRHLREHYSSSKWIIMGDTNIPTSQRVPSSIQDTFQDAWLAVHGSEDGGATYNPDSNALAAATVKQDRSQQRYDRIWVRHDSKMRVQAVEMFGQGAAEASDHYGLAAALVFTDSIDHEPGGPSTTAGPVFHLKAQDVSKGIKETLDEDLRAFVYKWGGYPTVAQSAQSARVAFALRTVLSPSALPLIQADQQAPKAFPPSGSDHELPVIDQPRPAVRLKLVPVGSFGLGVDTQNSDLDMLVVGNISPETFWALARARLRKVTPKLRDRVDTACEESIPSIVLKRFVKDASVQMMELLVGGIPVDMQYCSAGKVLDSWDQMSRLSPTDPLFLLPAPSLRTLNAYRDMLHILHILPTSSLPAFRLAHRALKLFCVTHGIYSSRLGYLGGIHITLLLTRVTLLSPPDTSAWQLISAFLTMFAEWDWAHQVVTIPGVDYNTAYARSPGREPMVILSVQRPAMNVVQNANKHTMKNIACVFKRAHLQVIEGAAWADICGSGGVCGTGFERFLRAHRSYIKVDLSFWGSSVVKVRSWIRFVESRLPQLLVQLQTALPIWDVRLWPMRLADGSSPGDLSTGLQSFYLLGVDASINPTSGKRIEAALFAFEDQLRRYERYYDASEMFVSVSQTVASHLPEIITTPVPWVDGGIDPEDDNSDEEEEDPSEDERDPTAAFSSVSAKQLKSQRQQQSRGSGTSHVPAVKLRTSSDVYNRLVWDRELKNAEYLIGYEDRFAGLKEMALASWKREVEDEAFVPFHRVVHFRRKGDGVLIWDRRKKIDLVFGSGIQQDSLT